MANKDYYQILGISNNASASEIKKAYRGLAMQCHPDRNHGKEEWANDKFKEINEAFSVLGNPEKRKHYDHCDALGNIDDIFSSQATRTTFEDLINDFEGASLGFDFFSNLLGDHFKGKEFAFQTFKRGLGRHRVTGFETKGSIDLEDLFAQVQNPEVSSTKYEIILSKEQALKGTEKELIRKGKRIKVKIPTGVRRGSKIRLRNVLKTTDGQSGDIIISIKIK